MSEKEFPKGVYFNAPREGAPDFVKGSVSVKVAEFGEYLKTVTPNNPGYIYLDVLESREGKPYLQLNNYQPAQKIEPQDEINADDIPF